MNWPQEIRDKVFPKTYTLRIGRSDVEIPIAQGSLFEQFLGIKYEKLPRGFIVRVQKYHLVKRKDFMDGTLALRAAIHNLCKDQNNEDLFLKALYILDEHVAILKKHLAVYGEIVPESPEELAIMKIMED
jgi:hypothetical protein